MSKENELGRFSNERIEETVQSMEMSNKITITGLQSLILINGGGVIASLSLLSAQPDNMAFLAAAATGVRWFVSGLVLSMLCIVSAYIAQEIITQRSKYMTHGQVVAVLIALASITCFSIGAFSSLDALSSTPPTTT